MRRRFASAVVAALACACAASANAQQVPEETSSRERQCVKRGWQIAVRNVAGIERRVLWKAPQGAWPKGAIVVMHGGGGHYHQFCVANLRLVAPQVRFSELALASGFAVFLLESSDRVTDNEQRACGKVWDDEVRARPNLDLPFIGEVIGTLVPQARPAGSREAVFLTGLSSGGYMALRAATHFGSRIAAFAPVSSGDPYGWHRICEKGMTMRVSVHGVPFDNETGKRVSEAGACSAETRANEKPWEGDHQSPKPAFRAFYHRDDGVHDRSCVEKAIALLRQHGYPEAPAFVLEGDGRRSLGNHLWQDAYNEPLLNFFAIGAP